MPPVHERKATTVAVGLGSNVGDRVELLRFGVRELERRLERMVVSPLYRSPPREGAQGGEFLNACATGLLSGERTGAAEDGPAASAAWLLAEFQYIEHGAGRPIRRERRAARTLDLDLLLFGDRRVETAELTVPHPRLTERDFVLQPLSEIAPGWRVPGRDATVGDLAGRVGDRELEEARPSELGG